MVEPDPIVLDRLKGWAVGRPGVRVVEGFWQTALPALGRYDAVFFDDFPVSLFLLCFPAVIVGVIRVAHRRLSFVLSLLFSFGVRGAGPQKLVCFCAATERSTRS